MIDQKILLEMAVLDSIFVDEKEVDNALEQQIQLLISESGGKTELKKSSVSPFQSLGGSFGMICKIDLYRRNISNSC